MADAARLRVLAARFASAEHALDLGERRDDPQQIRPARRSGLGYAWYAGFIRRQEVVSLSFASWNRTVTWLRQLEAIRAVA